MDLACFPDALPINDIKGPQCDECAVWCTGALPCRRSSPLVFSYDTSDTIRAMGERVMMRIHYLSLYLVMLCSPMSKQETSEYWPSWHNDFEIKIQKWSRSSKVDFREIIQSGKRGTTGFLLNNTETWELRCVLKTSTLNKALSFLGQKFSSVVNRLLAFGWRWLGSHEHPSDLWVADMSVRISRWPCDLILPA